LQWTILKCGFSSLLAILQYQRGLELKSLAIIITLTSYIFLCVLRDATIIILYYIQLTKPSCPPLIFLVVLNYI
jgi:hypothetical protein